MYFVLFAMGLLLGFFGGVIYTWYALKKANLLTQQALERK